MTDLSRAYRTLQLEPGVSLRDIVEARDDLLYLWDPARMADRPRLRSRAQHKQEEIKAAATLLLESLSAGSPELYSSKTASPASSEENPSLYDEVFSPVRTNSWVPFAVTAGLILVAALALFMLYSRSPASDPQVDPEAAAESGPAEPSSPADPMASSTAGEPAAQPVSATTESSSPDARQPPPAKPPSEPTPTPAVAPAARPAAPARSQASSGSRPVLLRGTPPPPLDPPGETSPPPDPGQPPTAASVSGTDGQAAFDLLLEQSRAARMLAGGRFPDLPFNGWNIVEKQGDEFYIDLAIEKDGTTVHFIWGVDTEAKVARPLSQAARDLEVGSASQEGSDPSSWQGSSWNYGFQN